MTSLQTSALIVLAVLSGGAAIYWFIVLGHVVATWRALPTARDGLRLPEAEVLRTSAPRVAVVIPAHNEEAVIAIVARSLIAEDYPALTVTFALDRCTDRTEAILHETLGTDPRFTIHTISACPPDWAGKVHAIHDAVQHSTACRDADLLLFADADTMFAPGCVRACVAILQSRRLDLLSLLSTLTSDRWFERLVQPVAGMELARQYPPRRVGRGRATRPFANGQFMLFTREAYHAIGGHAAAKDELLEDIHLARLVAWSDRTVGVFMAAGMLRCRMYPDWTAFRPGWKRIYIEAANRRAPRLLSLAIRLCVTSVLTPTASAVGCAAGLIVWRFTGEPLALITGLCGLAGSLAVLIGGGAAFALGGAPVWSVLALPFGAARVAGILAEAGDDLAQGRVVKWGGREYVRPRR